MAINRKKEGFGFSFYKDNYKRYKPIFYKLTNRIYTKPSTDLEPQNLNIKSSIKFDRPHFSSTH